MGRTHHRSPRHAPRVAVGSGLLIALSVAACFSGDPAASGGSLVAIKLRGCTVEAGSPPPVAPGGYYTNGTTVCTADGTPHLFHGVDRPSLEWDPFGEGPSPGGGQQEGISAADFQEMAAWRANVVRIALNQDYWLSGAYLHNNMPGAENYQATVDQAVHDAEAAGLDVILDLHWSDQGNLGVTVAGGSSKQDSPGDSNQQQMADVNSKEFWLEVATKYKDDGRVLFELYNEPNGIAWSVWLNGASASTSNTGFQVVGMQELYDTVRNDAHADNVVIAGGLSYAFDLSGVAMYPIQGYNIMYATHPYSGNDTPGEWPGSFGYLAAGDIAPVIATEFGDVVNASGDASVTCSGAWDTSLIQFSNMYQISWTAWAWFYPGPEDLCGFPALISNWSYAPTAQGAAVKSALLTYPAPALATDEAGADATFDDAPADVSLDGGGNDAGSDDASSGDASSLDDSTDAPAFDDVSDGGATTDGAGDDGPQTD